MQRIFSGEFRCLCPGINTPSTRKSNRIAIRCFRKNKACPQWVRLSVL